MAPAAPAGAQPPAAQRVESAPATTKGYQLGVLWPAARAKAHPGGFAEAPSRLETALGSVAATKAAAVPAAHAPRRVAIVRLPSAMAAYRHAEALARQGEKDLLAAPELALGPAVDAKDPKQARQKIADLSKAILAANVRERDGFIQSLRKQRADLAGLPFRLGKDCAISKAEAAVLAQSAAAIRIALCQGGQRVSGSGTPLPFNDSVASVAESFWSALAQVRSENDRMPDFLRSTAGLPALIADLRS